MVSGGVAAATVTRFSRSWRPREPGIASKMAAGTGGAARGRGYRGASSGRAGVPGHGALSSLHPI